MLWRSITIVQHLPQSCQDCKTFAFLTFVKLIITETNNGLILNY